MIIFHMALKMFKIKIILKESRFSFKWGYKTEIC